MPILLTATWRDTCSVSSNRFGPQAIDFAAIGAATQRTGAISQWTFLRGHWRLEDGAYHGSGASVSESYTADPAWRDLVFEVDLVPVAGTSHNINVRVQGARRSYAVGLAPDNRVVIHKNARGYRPVAEVNFAWERGVRYRLRVAAVGATITVTLNDHMSLAWTDPDGPYLNGQIGLSNFTSHARYERVRVVGKE